MTDIKIEITQLENGKWEVKFISQGGKGTLTWYAKKLYNTESAAIASLTK